VLAQERLDMLEAIACGMAGGTAYEDLAKRLQETINSGDDAP
jgi:hypothetical protein